MVTYIFLFICSFIFAGSENKENDTLYSASTYIIDDKIKKNVDVSEVKANENFHFESHICRDINETETFSEEKSEISSDFLKSIFKSIKERLYLKKKMESMKADSKSKNSYNNNKTFYVENEDLNLIVFCLAILDIYDLPDNSLSIFKSQNHLLKDNKEDLKRYRSEVSSQKTSKIFNDTEIENNQNYNEVNNSTKIPLSNNLTKKDNDSFSNLYSDKNIVDKNSEDPSYFYYNTKNPDNKISMADESINTNKDKICSNKWKISRDDNFSEKNNDKNAEDDSNVNKVYENENNNINGELEFLSSSFKRQNDILCSEILKKYSEIVDKLSSNNQRENAAQKFNNLLLGLQQDKSFDLMEKNVDDDDRKLIHEGQNQESSEFFIKDESSLENFTDTSNDEFDSTEFTSENDIHTAYLYSGIINDPEFFRFRSNIQKKPEMINKKKTTKKLSKKNDAFKGNFKNKVSEQNPINKKHKFHMYEGSDISLISGIDSDASDVKNIIGDLTKGFSAVSDRIKHVIEINFAELKSEILENKSNVLIKITNLFNLIYEKNSGSLISAVEEERSRITDFIFESLDTVINEEKELKIFVSNIIDKIFDEIMYKSLDTTTILKNINLTLEKTALEFIEEISNLIKDPEFVDPIISKLNTKYSTKLLFTLKDYQQQCEHVIKYEYVKIFEFIVDFMKSKISDGNPRFDNLIKSGNKISEDLIGLLTASLSKIGILCEKTFEESNFKVIETLKDNENLIIAIIAKYFEDINAKINHLISTEKESQANFTEEFLNNNNEKILKKSFATLDI